MTILYIFPHPDDESFGPAAAMHKHAREGHDVRLLTLTRGGATKQRFKLGLSVEEMGAIRCQEMEEMAKVLKLTELKVLDLPDSGMKEMDPREIEAIIAAEIERVRPDIIVTYAVFGVSGFEDHLVTHAIVKRVYCQMRDDGAGYLKRLAMHTIEVDHPVIQKSTFNLRGTKPEEIDCIMQADEEDWEARRQALTCYKTYQDVIKSAAVTDVGNTICFEFYRESFQPPVDDLFAGLEG
jgi:N-acetylglucosamine malate deacetylase 2